MVRDQRHLFLSKLAWKRFRGYAWAQLHKLESKDPQGQRKELIDKFGFDVKYAYHVVRLLDEAEQILLEGTLDLQRSREVLKAIRRGEWSPVEIKRWAQEKEQALEIAYTRCSLPETPPETPLKQLLLDCLEHHYGSLSDCIQQPDWSINALRELDQWLDRYRRKLYQQLPTPPVPPDADNTATSNQTDKY